MCETTDSKKNYNDYVEPGAVELESMALPTRFDPARVQRRAENVQYGTLDCQRLDLYYPPEGDGPFPLLFYIHGGGWAAGNRRFGALDSVIDAIDFGYAVAAVDYRLAPESPFPDFIFDVKTAVRWARANAERYHFDQDRFCMAGDSAGGHITLTVAFTAGRPEYEGEEYGWENYSSAVQAVCSMFGPSDLSADDAAFFHSSGVKRVRWSDPNVGDYKRIFGTRHERLLRLISPITLAHKDIPPVLLMHGCRDAVVPYQHSSLLAEKLDKICPGRALLRLYPERNHSDREFLTRANCKEIIDFFDGHLRH